MDLSPVKDSSRQEEADSPALPSQPSLGGVNPMEPERPKSQEPKSAPAKTTTDPSEVLSEVPEESPAIPLVADTMITANMMSITTPALDDNQSTPTMLEESLFTTGIKKAPAGGITSTNSRQTGELYEGVSVQPDRNSSAENNEPKSPVSTGELCEGATVQLAMNSTIEEGVLTLPESTVEPYKRVVEQVMIFNVCVPRC